MKTPIKQQNEDNTEIVARDFPSKETNKGGINSITNLKNDSYYDSFADHNEYYVPSYILQEYKRYYISNKYAKFFNKPFINNIRLFGQQKKLHNLVIQKLKPKDKVLLVGNTYGPLTTKIINKIGPQGKLDIVDALPNQLLLAKNQLKQVANNKNLETLLQDAKNLFYRKYDAIVMFMLLGEVPHNYKVYILENALRVVNDDNAKLIIVDYHAPSYFNPLTNILKFNNFFFKPYTSYLWDNDIENIINKPFNYNISTKTYFGSIYQAIEITKKI